MSGPFKMKGSSSLGHGNQHSSTAGMPFASSAKEETVRVDMNDPKIRANYEKYKDNPEYRKAMDKKAGGKFDYDEITNISTTEKPVKK